MQATTPLLALAISATVARVVMKMRSALPFRWDDRLIVIGCVRLLYKLACLLLYKLACLLLYKLACLLLYKLACLLLYKLACLLLYKLACLTLFT
jgi:hypothetical protein